MRVALNALALARLANGACEETLHFGRRPLSRIVADGRRCSPSRRRVADRLDAGGEIDRDDGFGLQVPRGPRHVLRDGSYAQFRYAVSASIDPITHR